MGPGGRNLTLDTLLLVASPASARLSGSPLTLAHWTGARLALMAEQSQQPLVEELAQKARRMGIEVVQTLVPKLKRDALLSCARAQGADLVALERELALSLFPLEPDASCAPLWILHQPRAQMRNIVAILPRLDESRATLSLREEVCETAIQLAGALNGGVTLVQIWKLPRLILGRGRQAHVQEENMADEEATRQLEALEAFAAAYSDSRVPITTWLQHGDLAARLMARTAELHAHTVVLGWDHQGARGLAGEGWEQLRRELPCSLLVVRR